MVESREWVNRAELMRKLSWVLGIDLDELETIHTLEFYNSGVKVDLGYSKYDKQFIPWREKRQGVGSLLRANDPEFDHDQEMLL